MMEAFDELGLRASVMLNSDVCAAYPQIIEAGVKRGWAWLAHGKNNSIFEAGMSPDEERAYLSNVVGTIEAATGTRPKGWLGPALTETLHTPEILGELGLTYVCDWCCDDQPFPLNVRSGPMLSMPYSIEVNDIPLFVGKSLSGSWSTSSTCSTRRRSPAGASCRSACTRSSSGCRSATRTSSGRSSTS
jgi:peptidoglycan/xylan/chitin deacetylase (PgdA/CDA1 family)